MRQQLVAGVEVLPVGPENTRPFQDRTPPGRGRCHAPGWFPDQQRHRAQSYPPRRAVRRKRRPPPLITQHGVLSKKANFVWIPFEALHSMNAL